MRRALGCALLFVAACTDFDALVGGTAPPDQARVTPADLSTADLAQSVEDQAVAQTDLHPICNDGVLGGGESDVDCGGGCLPCDVGRACFADGDCQTGFCDQNRCELVTGPPGWLQVGTPPGGGASPIARYDVAMERGPDNNLYLVGGRDRLGNFLDDVERLDESLSWAPIGKLQKRRARAASTASATAMWVLYGDDMSPPTSVEKMTTPPSFALATGLTAQRSGAGAAVGSDGRVYFYGGNDGSNTLDLVSAFAPTDTVLTSLASMGAARERFGATAGPDGRLYAMGGVVDNSSLSSCEAYSITNNSWATVATLPQPRGAAPAVLAPDGRIYIAGGADLDAGQVLPSVVAYRAPTSATPDRWAKIAPLATPRWRHGAAVGADGRIYVAAGAALQGQVRTVEAYGPLVALSAATVAAGGMVQVSGSNFAKNAAVSVTLGSATSTAIATGTTDGNGGLAAFAVTIPASTTVGPTRLYVTDARSRYPVSAKLNVSP